QGFTDGNTSGNDYAYDTNGNMVMDRNKAIGNDSSKYNDLNLPVEALKNNGEKLVFVYNATGTKLSQEEYDTLGVLKVTREYAGEFIYKNDTLEFISHEEGRVNTQKAQPTYEYVLKDHLGNTRVTFTTQQQQD